MNTLPTQEQESQREQRIDALLADLSITNDSEEAAEKSKELYRLMVGEEGTPPHRLDQVGRLVKEGFRVTDQDLVASRQTLLIGTVLGVFLNLWAIYSLAHLPAAASQFLFDATVAYCCTAYATLIYIAYKWGIYRGYWGELKRSKRMFSSVVNRSEDAIPSQEASDEAERN